MPTGPPARPEAPLSSEHADLPMVQTSSIMHRFFAVALGLFVLFWAGPAPQALAQPADPVGALDIAVRGDSAYVFHTARLPLGYGVRMERRTANGFVPIGDTLYYPAASSSAFAAAVGPDRFNQIRRATRATSIAQVYYRIRSDISTAVFLSYAYAEVGRALGRLAIDPDAPVGTSATYRAIIVDDLGVPQGDTLQATARLVEVVAPVPTELAVENDAGDIELTWTYPQPRDDADDQVVRFDVARRVDGGELVSLTGDAAILRNEAQNEFRYRFELPARGQTEEIVVRAVQITGRTFDSESLRIVVEDNVPPEVVFDAEVYIGEGEVVEINWPVSTDPDAAGYFVYRAEKLRDEFQKLHESPLDLLETVYEDTTARPLTTYFYKVSAVDSVGNESELSNAVMADVRDQTPPSAPTNLRGSVLDSKQIELAWSAPGGVPSDLKTYEVFYRRTGSNDAYARADPGDLRDTVFTSALTESSRFTDGAIYTVGVAAVDYALNPSDSAFVEVKVPDLNPPTAPESITTLNDLGVRAVVQWTRSLSGDVAEYRVYRAPGETPVDTVASDSAWAIVRHPKSNVTDDEIKTGESFRYTVTAVDSIGNESPRSPTAVFTLRDRTSPPAVRNVQALQQEAGVLVVWEPSPASDVASYRVMRSDLPTGRHEVVGLVPRDDTRYVDDSGHDGHFYRVHAIDTSGNLSNASEPAVARPSQ